MANKKSDGTCTICKKCVVAGAATAPFCSDRCRLIDLGNWLGGRYVIPGSKNESEVNVNDDGDE